MTAVYVTLANHTPCRVDVEEGDAWRLDYDERCGEERWVRLAVSGDAWREALRLAEMRLAELQREADEAFADLRDSMRYWGPADVERAEKRWHDAERALDAAGER